MGNKQLKAGDALPAFSVTDINGREVSNESLKGKETLIVFWRFAGCGICATNMLPFTAHLKDIDNTNIVYFYSSDEDKCKTLQEIVPINDNIHIVADPSRKIYDLIDIYSAGKLSFMKQLFIALMNKSKNTKPLKDQGIFVDVMKKIKMDGNMFQLPADFFVDENGILTKAHYGKTISDHVSLDEVKAYTKSNQDIGSQEQKAA